jgi:peptidyl-prolyl cis-trans isomerase D
MRADLEPEYRRELAQNLFYDRSQQLADESFASLSELDSVAKKLGMPLQTVTGFTRQGGGGFGADRKVIEAVFSDAVLQDRQNSAPIQLADDSVVVLRVTDHKPSQQLALEAVRDQITARVAEDSARAAAAKAGQELAQRLNAGDAYEAAVAAVGGTAPTPAQAVTRQGPATETGAPMPPELVKAVFQAPRPAAGKSVAGSATLASGDQAVFVISGVESGKPEGEPAALAQRVQASAAQHAQTEFEAYLQELRRGAKIKKNDTLFAADQ